MSDIKENVSEPVVEETPVVEPTSDQAQPKEETNDKDSIESLKNDLKEDLRNDMSKYWEEKEKTYKNQIKGLDRKVSELTQQKKKLEQKEMTQEEILEEERTTLNDEYQKLWRDVSIVQVFNELEDEDRSIVKTYLYGNNQDEVQDSAKALFDIFQKYVKSGIEKGVEERILQGYKPAGHFRQGGIEININDMSREQLVEKVKEASKMPDGPEKSKILDELAKAQGRRFSAGGK